MVKNNLKRTKILKQKSFNIFIDDFVQIISGEGKGKDGFVVHINRKTNMVIIDTKEIFSTNFETHKNKLLSLEIVKTHVSNIRALIPIESLRFYV